MTLAAIILIVFFGISIPAIMLGTAVILLHEDYCLRRKLEKPLIVIIVVAALFIAGSISLLAIYL